MMGLSTRQRDEVDANGITLLRAAVASIFVIHGVTRAFNGTVDDFGGFLPRGCRPEAPLPG